MKVDIAIHTSYTHQKISIKTIIYKDVIVEWEGAVALKPLWLLG